MAKSTYEQQTRYSNKWIRTHPEKRVVSVARARAKKRGIEFSITHLDITVPEFCPILGLKLEFNIGTGAGGKANSPSLDKIDPTKGYVKGNVQVISHLANNMKSFSTKEQRRKFAEWVLKNE